MVFGLTEDENMAGELSIWYSEKYKVMATPCFNDVPIAIEVLEIGVKGDCNIIDADGYYGKVNSFKQYLEIVKTLTKKILDNHKTQ